MKSQDVMPIVWCAVAVVVFLYIMVYSNENVEVRMRFGLFNFKSKVVVRLFLLCLIITFGIMVFVVRYYRFGLKKVSINKTDVVSAFDVEKIKAKLVEKNPEVSEYFDEEFSKERKKLFNKLMSFVEKMPIDEVLHGENSKNKGWDACIEDYLVKFLKKEGGQPNVLNRADFKKYLDNAGIVSVFRLMDSEKADRLKNGEVQFDVGVANSYHAGPIRPCGVGIYVAGDEEMAKKAYWIEDELRQANDLKQASGKKLGKVVEMALDLKNSRIIDLNRLRKFVVATLIENYALVISEFEKACELNHMNICGDAVIHCLNELRSCVDEYGTMGFDYFGYDRKIRKTKLQEKIKSVAGGLKNCGDRLIYGEEMNNFLNFGCDVEKLISLFLVENYAFIARVLGYDVVSFNERGGVKNKESYVVVNPRILAICGD